MTLFVRLADVPSEILELVKARIMANRKRNRQQQQAVAAPSSKTPRRRYYNPEAADRRPEPGAVHVPALGTTGLAWVAWPYKRGYFSGTWFWTYETFDPDDHVVDDNDRFYFSVGSGDGSKWIASYLTLPGVAAYRAQRRSFFTPIPDDFIGTYSGNFFRTSPVGKILANNIGNGYLTDESRFNYLALPCGNGSAIVLVMARASAAWRAEKFVCTAAEPAAEFGVFGWRATADEMILSDMQTITASDIAAFIVSQTDCRQITVPALLRQRLGELLLDAQWNTPFTWVPNPDLAVSYEVVRPSPTSEYWAETDSPIFGTIAFRKYEQYIAQPIFSTYGADGVAMKVPDQWNRIRADTSTPAIYLLLNKPSEVLNTLPDVNDTESFDFNYAAARETLRGFGAPAPSHIVSFDSRREEYMAMQNYLWYGEEPWFGTTAATIYLDPEKRLTGLGVVRSSTQPDTYSDYLLQSSPWRPVKFLPLSTDRIRPYNSGPVNNDNYSLLWHYDWGEPNYCRQQLLQLGFTADDLKP